MNRVERRKEETRGKIISTALDLFRKQGIDATTMEQIAAEVDISRGTLYNYFPVKEAIVDEYIRRSFERQRAARLERVLSASDTRARMLLFFEELLAGVQVQKRIFERYVAYRMQSWVSFQQDKDERSGFHEIAAEIITLGRESGEIRTDQNFEILLDLTEYVFMLVVKQLYVHPETFEVRPAIQNALDLLMQGIGAESEKRAVRPG